MTPPLQADAAPATWKDILPVVRSTVRTLLLASPAFARLDDSERRQLAEAMVKVCHTAAALIREETEQRESLPDGVPQPLVYSPPRHTRSAPLATAQNAGTEFSGVSASRVAGTTQAILNAVSFPRFVTELINGVFQAMIHSSQQQMQSYVELLRNVAATTEGFADASMSNDRARAWLADRYPGSFEIAQEDPEDVDPEEPPPERRLQLRPGASWPTEAALRADLGLPSDQSVPSGDPDRTLVPPARVAIAQQRQQMLATLVMMGMQRIVVDGGRITASMHFHIDTRSAAEDDRASQFDFRNTINAAGSFGVGVWGASAAMTNTIGYVSTQKTRTTEELNTDLDLSSSVEILFKSDYLPLNRLAGNDTIDKIRANSLNPEAEAKEITRQREARRTAQVAGDAKRREAPDGGIPAPPEAPKPPKPGEPGTVKAADEERKKAKARDDKEAKKQPKKTDRNPANPRTTAESPGGRTGGSPRSTTRRGASTTPGSPRGTSSRSAEPAPAPTEAGTDGQSADGESTAPTRSPATRTAAFAGASPTPAVREARVIPDVPFVPSWDECLDEMLRLAEIQPDDLVYDLGCGDGRLVILAAKRYGCRAVGFDIDPRRVAEARRHVEQHGVSDRVRVEQRDLFAVNLRPATVVLMYLLPVVNARLVPQLRRLRPGTRVVSQDFTLPGFVPERIVQVFLRRLGFSKTFHLWRAPFVERPTPARPEWSNATRFVPE